MGRPKNTAVEFWSRVQKSEGCWLWVGNKWNNGYGRFQFEDHAWPAHRLAYTLAVGPVPEGRLVCHRCDTPLCCRPDHLFVGTVKDNAADMVAKERSAHLGGERHYGHKLTDALVRRIRAEYLGGRTTLKVLAARYGVGHVAVYNAVHGLTWKHLAPSAGEREMLRRHTRGLARNRRR